MIERELLVREAPEAYVAQELATAMREAVDERGRCLLVLSGGSTPLPSYRQLSRAEDLPWQSTHLFWADERFVPPDHRNSNRRAIEDALLNHVAVPDSQVHPWPILASAEESAEAYAGELSRIVSGPITFDVTLLGLGADCHTASLFPGTGAVRASGLTTSSRPRGVSEARLSLTASALSDSRLVIFLVTGEEKLRSLQSLLDDRDGADVEECPARAITALERFIVVTDQRLGR